MQLLIFRAACDCRRLVQSSLPAKPGKVAACRQLPGFPEPEDSRLCVTRPPLLTGPRGFIVLPLPSAAGLAAERAHTRCLCLARVRSHAEHPAPNPARAFPPQHPQPWPPRLQPSPAGLLRRCCHLERRTPSLLRQPRARGSLPGCRRGPPGGEAGARLHPCSVSSQGRAVVLGWEEGVTLRVTVPLHPTVTLSSPWIGGLSLEGCFGRGGSPSPQLPRRARCLPEPGLGTTSLPWVGSG